MNFWKGGDEERATGAASVLAEAATLARELTDRGPCPLTKVHVEAAAALAAAALVLLRNIRHPGDPS